jgi:hypothetical protein
MESPPGSERVSRRLREQFAPAYLAITGLVQVLVLDALITKVEGDYTDYGAVRDRPTWCWPAAAMATSTSPGRTQGSPYSSARWRRSAG